MADQSPFRFFVYLATDASGRSMYFVYETAKCYRPPDDYDANCIYRGDDYDKARHEASLANRDLLLMKKKQTGELSL